MTGISLLNTDAKILAKALALRLDEALPHIISTDQTGFIKNRHSFFNSQRLLDVLYTPSHDKIPECIVSIDAQKAFDHVEWRYLFLALNKFGFAPMFIGWVKLLYAAPTATVQTNGITFCAGLRNTSRLPAEPDSF